jgi:hypothetical protein
MTGVEAPAQTKLCGRCATTKPVAAFHRRGKGHQAWCKECRKAYDREDYEVNYDRHRERTRQGSQAWSAWLRGLKEEPCTDCRQRFHFAAMQYDHTGTDKTLNVAAMIGCSRERTLVEINKCELVCANCHAVRTWTRRQSPVV